MERAGLLSLVSEADVFGSIDEALNRARELLGLPKIQKPAFAVPTVTRESPPTPKAA